MSAERLQKVLARAGVASRRDCEELIAAGRVTVNGRVVRVLGTRVDLATDEVAIDGKVVQLPEERTYVVLHKPAGVISTAEDPQGRPTVIDQVDLPVRLFPVGRLDLDSEGLLLLTDDGALTHQLTHPSFEVEKEYRALLDQTPTADALRDWRNGVLLHGEPTAAAWVDVIERTDTGTWVRVVLHEGRKRQIREVARLLGYEVLRLIRVREGPLQLGDLPAGEWRRLTAEEVTTLQRHAAKAPLQHESSRSRRTARADDEGQPAAEPAASNPQPSGRRAAAGAVAGRAARSQAGERQSGRGNTRGDHSRQRGDPNALSGGQRGRTDARGGEREQRGPSRSTMQRYADEAARRSSGERRDDWRAERDRRHAERRARNEGRGGGTRSYDNRGRSGSGQRSYDRNRPATDGRTSARDRYTSTGERRTPGSERSRDRYGSWDDRSRNRYGTAGERSRDRYAGSGGRSRSRDAARDDGAPTNSKPARSRPERTADDDLTND